MNKAIKNKKKGSCTTVNVHLTLTSNNILVTATDTNGNRLSGSSGGKFFKGSKKSTAHAAGVVVEDAIKDFFRDFHVKTISKIVVKGISNSRDSAVKKVMEIARGFNITCEALHDRTPVPHNGCKPPKKRRV